MIPGVPLAGVSLAGLQAQYSQQAEVTEWPLRLALTAAVAAVIGLTLWAMRRGWRHRTARQAWLALPEVPAGFAADIEHECRYVATVLTADWLDRVTAAGLGMPGEGSVAVGRAGVLVRRVGEAELFLPIDRLVGVGSAKGMAQQVYEQDGLLTLTWRAGEKSLTTGLRMADPAAQITIMNSVDTLIREAAT